MFNKKEIGKRLRTILIDKFGSINESARVLDKTSANLRNNYLNGKSIPGPELLSKLLEYGCDIQWLLTGKENLFMQKNHETYERIGSEIEKLDKQFPNLDSTYEVFDRPVKSENESYEEFSIRSSAMNLVRHWRIWKSLFPEEIVELSKINNISLEWLLGYNINPHFETLIKDYHNGKHFQKPDENGNNNKK